MSIHVGPYFDCREAEGPKAYEVRNGQRFLSALEDGKVQCWPEYHLILIDERTGNLLIEGGYGTFSYGWSRSGRDGESLHSFLYDLDFDYFMKKAAKQPYRVIDLDATVKGLRKDLLRERHDGSYTRDEAREMWETLEAAEGYGSGLVDRLCEDGQWSEFLDYSDPSVMVDHPRMRRFWDEVWTPFAEAVLRPHWLQHIKQRPIPARRALTIQIAEAA
jgi:hypothetical protein